MSQYSEYDEQDFLDIITPCKSKKPNPENCPKWQTYADKETKKLYERCEDDWCKTCNEVYHKACDSILENIKAVFPLIQDASDMDTILKTLQELSKRSLKTDIQKQAFVDKNGLFMKFNSCYSYRKKHHDSCIRDYTTKIIGQDSTHNHKLKEIRQVKELAKKNYSKIKRSKDKEYKFIAKSFRSSKKKSLIKNRGKNRGKR
jgi:hypothetical protein